jgi:RNA-binding protein
VIVGKGGVTESLISATQTALDDHELVKIRLGENAEGDREALGEELGRRTGSAVVGAIGRTLLLYRRHPKEPKIVLPGAPKRAAKQAAKARGAKAQRRTVSATRITKKR